MASHAKCRTVTAMLRTQGTPGIGNPPKASQEGSPGRDHRPALDGLRALAVLSVIAYHLGSTWLPGGFLGVDLFFVLSGFLITSVLLDALSRTGRIDYAAFYTRRTRRLLPAFLLLVLTLCGWAAFVAEPSEIGDLRGAALAALFYVANWFFIATGQSYFADQLGPSPLEHTWSLSIEEQYYLVWPALLVLLVRRLPTRALTLCLIVVIAGSALTMAWLYSPSDPTTAYFSTFARLHELLIGSLLALAIHKGLRVPQRFRWTSWIALGGIVLSFALMNDTTAFYYQGGSVLFSLAAAWLILGLGTGPADAPPIRFLTGKPLVWIGLISYGLYLWHWPLIVLLTPASTGLTGAPLTLLRLGLTVSIAGASYYLLEQPIRRGRIGSLQLTPRRVAALATAAVLTVSVLMVLSTARSVPATESVNLDVTSAPSGLSGANQEQSPTLAIVGDSIPTQAMAHFERATQDRNWNLLPLAYGGCSATGPPYDLGEILTP